MDESRESPEVPPGQGPLCVAARFAMPMEAEVFAARLLQEGIAARVMDGDNINAYGALASGGFAGGLVGGVRVMVPQSQLSDAQRVREKLDAGDYAIDESFDPGPG
jgi:hypothetical protein